jgi:hypothetical protein
MEPNNIENQIREKLNSREIQPSAKAWDRLDAMLTVAEEKKTKRSFFSYKYIGIAASVLVFVTLGLFFLNQKSTVIEPQNTVVETIVKRDSIKDVVIQTEVNKEKQVVETNNNNQKVNNKGVSIITQEQGSNALSNQKNNQSQSFGTNINRDKEIEYMIGEVVGIKDLPKIDTSTKIFIPKTTSKKPTYINPEDLLASVENTNKIQANPKTDKIKVDTMTLLSNADSEVETSFREKVINKVSKNYKEVKVALSTRNHE